MADTKTPEGDMAVAGDLLVAERAYLRGNLRCDGQALVGRQARIDGNVDATKGVVVRAGVRIRGAVTTEGEVDWHPTAQAASLRCGGPFRVDRLTVAASVEAAEGVHPAPQEVPA